MYSFQMVTDTIHKPSVGPTLKVSPGPPNATRAPLQQDNVVALHASAPGKAVLATLSDPELDRILEGLAFEATTAATITEESALRAELDVDTE